MSTITKTNFGRFELEVASLVDVLQARLADPSRKGPVAWTVIAQQLREAQRLAERLAKVAVDIEVERDAAELAASRAPTQTPETPWMDNLGVRRSDR